MITFQCNERIIVADGKSYDFSVRLNHRWYFLCILGHNASRFNVPTTLEQLQEIPRFRTRTVGRQIANWFRRDARIRALVACESPTKGPYSLKGNLVEILDGDAIFRDLRLDIEPRRPQWRKTRGHLEEYVQASACFQDGKILKALNTCNMLLKKQVDWGLRFECGLLMARAYTALGFFGQAKQALASCTSPRVTEFQARIKITEARIDYFAERYDDARRALDSPVLRNLPWFARADWLELSALLEGRQFKHLSDQGDAAADRAMRRGLQKRAEVMRERAEYYLEEALSLRLLHADPQGLQATCFNLGNLLWKVQPNEGRDWIGLSRTICQRWGVGKDTILTEFVLARLDLHANKLDAAWDRAQAAFRDAHRSDNVFDRATAHRQHARYYFTLGKADEEERQGLAHAFVCDTIYNALRLQESVAALSRDFPKQLARAREVFEGRLASACQVCAALPVLRAVARRV